MTARYPGRERGSTAEHAIDCSSRRSSSGARRRRSAGGQEGAPAWAARSLRITSSRARGLTGGRWTCGSRRSFAPGQGLAGHLQLHVSPADPGDDRPGPVRAKKETGEAPAGGDPLPLRGVSLLDQLDGVVEHASQVHELRGGRPVPRSTGFQTWTAGAGAGAVCRLLSSRDNTYKPGTTSPRPPEGRPAADAERVPPRRRDDPALLGLGALLRPLGPGVRTRGTSGPWKPLLETSST